MSASIKLFDPVTGKQKTVAVTFERGILNDPTNGSEDSFIKLSISARTIAGDTINPFVISSQGDLVLGNTQYDEITTDDYADITAAVDDYMLRIMQGVPGDPDSALDFNS